jgi:hypothetical protein
MLHLMLLVNILNVATTFQKPKYKKKPSEISIPSEGFHFYIGIKLIIKKWGRLNFAKSIDN